MSNNDKKKKNGKDKRGGNGRKQKLPKSPEKIKAELIRSIQMPVTKADLELLELVKQGARSKCKRGSHHLYSMMLGKSGQYYCGLQQTYHRAADLETCAEEMAKGNLQLNADICVTVATVHFLPVPDREDGGITTIVPPCAGCGTRLRHLEITQGASLGVLVFHKNEVIKVPPEYAMLFTYPIAYNENGTSKF